MLQSRCPGGACYEGTFEKGLADGEGVLRRANGSLYTGSFPAGKPNGDGVFTCSLLSTLTKQRLKRGVFHFVADLQAAIKRYIDEHNEDPKPF